MDFGKPEVYKNYYSVLVRVKTTTGTAFRFYYTLDDGTETYASKTLTADKTRWYRISLGSGGKRGEHLNHDHICQINFILRFTD